MITESELLTEKARIDKIKSAYKRVQERKKQQYIESRRNLEESRDIEYLMGDE